MPAADPEKLKTVKSVSRPDIVFALARKPGTGHVFCGGSDFSVYELDLDAVQARAEGAGPSRKLCDRPRPLGHDADFRCI